MSSFYHNFTLRDEHKARGVESILVTHSGEEGMYCTVVIQGKSREVKLSPEDIIFRDTESLLIDGVDTILPQSLPELLQLDLATDELVITIKATYSEGICHSLVTCNGQGLGELLSINTYSELANHIFPLVAPSHWVRFIL